MIITDKFVMINFPKTGSSFAQDVIKELHIRQKSLLHRILYKTDLIRRPLFKSIMLPKTEFPGLYTNQIDQHGRWEQIPECYRDRPILSIMRNPYERYVSMYEYKWWVENPIDKLENVKAEFPDFPDLSFKEYLRYHDFNIRYRLPGKKLLTEVGNLTVQFIQFFFKDPAYVFSVLDDNYIDSGAYKSDMPDVTFLRTENINKDLYRFLLNQGYPVEQLSFILEKKPIRPGNTKRLTDKERQKYLTQDVINLVERKERLLFKICADHGAKYDPPAEARYKS